MHRIVTEWTGKQGESRTGVTHTEPKEASAQPGKHKTYRDWFKKNLNKFIQLCLNLKPESFTQPDNP